MRRKETLAQPGATETFDRLSLITTGGVAIGCGSSGANTGWEVRVPPHLLLLHDEEDDEGVPDGHERAHQERDEPQRLVAALQRVEHVERAHEDGQDVDGVHQRPGDHEAPAPVQGREERGKRRLDSIGTRHSVEADNLKGKKIQELDVK